MRRAESTGGNAGSGYGSVGTLRPGCGRAADLYPKWLDQLYPSGYDTYEFLRTEEVDSWLRALRDPLGKARILARLRSAEAGNLGDCASVGGGVLEMRVHVGPGYRVYLTQRGRSVYLLLCGGDKRSQGRDIRQALKMAMNLEDW